MASLNSDPHNHAPPVSADDEWADAYGAEELSSITRQTLPARRFQAPESTAPRNRTKSEMGIRIDVRMPARRPYGDDLPPPADDSPEEVVILEARSSETPFQARQTMAPFVKTAAPAPRSLHGEGSEWGKHSKTSTRWMVAAAGGVLLLVVAAIVGQDRWLRDPKQTVLPASLVSDGEPLVEVVGFELDGSSETEARRLLATYAQATTPAEVLPLIRNGKSLAARLKLDWQPWNPEPHWQAPSRAPWTVSADGGRSHGVIKGIKPDFSRFQAYFIREEDGLKLDWEATQGLGDASFETLLKGQGTGGKIRAFVKLDHFLTQIFPEDAYHSFQLKAPDGEHVIWGYSKLGSPADVSLMELFEPGLIREQDKSELPLTLRLEPGPEGCQKNQWLIGELLHIEWVSP